MNTLRDIMEAIQDTDQAASRLAEASASRPDDKILRFNAAGLQKRRADLTKRLNRSLRAQQGEYLEYSLDRSGSSRYPALGVAASITTFQELLTAIFDAFRTSPKRRYRPTSESMEFSTLDFLAARSGSVVLSFVVPNDRLPFIESDLEQALSTIAVIVRGRTAEEFRKLAERVGGAAMTKAYAWVSTAANYGTDVQLRWGRTVDSGNSLHVNKSDLLLVKSVLEITSEETAEVETVFGKLTGLDGTASYFHLEASDERDIKGKLADGFPKLEKWTLNVPYRARLSKITSFKYSTGEEIARWTLHELMSPD